MPQPSQYYPEVQPILQRLLADVKTILGDQFVGLYLHGSLALGDFDPMRSDVDFVVVTAGELDPATVAALSTMHEKMAAGESKWGHELEGSYVPRQALRRYDPAHATFPHIERGGVLRVERHHSDWLIQCHTLRRCGVVLAGPPPQALLDPISSATLRQALLDLLWWWDLQLQDTSRLQHSDYRVYAILTMCRMRYTMQHAAIISKPAAARWAHDHLDRRWHDLIQRALTWQPPQHLDALPQTLDFIRHTLRALRSDAA